MKNRAEIQIERNCIKELFETFQKNGKEFDSVYSLGALHVCEWILNNHKEPISELILFKFKMDRKLT